MAYSGTPNPRGQSSHQNRGSRDNRGSGAPQGHSGTPVAREILAAILDGDAKALVDHAEPIARDELLGDQYNKVTTSQIRNIFGVVKRLEMNPDDPQVFQQLILLKPKLAYIAGRHDRVPGLKYLQNVLSQSIDLVGKDRSRFMNFCRFFEAILAYHKAHGGK